MDGFGYFLSSGEHSPDALVAQARMAERAGSRALWISDHFHPGNDQQGFFGSCRARVLPHVRD